MTQDFEEPEPMKMDNDLAAYLSVIGNEGEIWCHLGLDVPEMTWPEYCHQN
ncbi:hypothetical protein ES705_26285 [subsurface metagenome]